MKIEYFPRFQLKQSYTLNTTADRQTLAYIKSERTMKRNLLIAIFYVFIVATLNGQDLSGFKYVYVPTLTYKNGGTDIWSISSKLRTSFMQKGLTVVNESSVTLREIQNNPCLLIRCFIDHTNVTIGTNSVNLTLKDCNDKIIATGKGSAAGWSVQDDFNKATRRAFNKINKLSYRFNANNTPRLDLPEVEKTNETEESLISYFDSNSVNQIEGIYKSYQSETLGYYKIGIKKYGIKYKAIILESDLSHWKEGEVKAVFEPSSMKGFFSTNWYTENKVSYKTFAMMENAAMLSIEFKNPETGQKRNDSFIKMYPKLDEHIRISEKPKSSGSGFFITKNGIIATNAHVVAEAESLNIQISNEMRRFEFSAKVLLVDNQNDVALIQINDPDFKELSEIPYSFVEQADIGAKVFTIGYPLNTVMGSNYKVTDGIISSASGISDDLRYYQISVPLQPGNSGGPLFNKNGDVIAITSARLDGEAVGTNIENVNYAVKISYLEGFA